MARRQMQRFIAGSSTHASSDGASANTCRGATGTTYYTTKNKRTMTGKLELKKYDPRIRKHVLFVEAKMPNPKKQG